MSDIDPYNIALILGLALVTVVTRAFFLFSDKAWGLPHWAQRGLQYAPIAAMAAVVVPEILTVQGRIEAPWTDARLYGALVGAVCYYWRRDVLVTIVAGMAVYMPLRMVWGW